jgi:hypothetical protein
MAGLPNSTGEGRAPSPSIPTGARPSTPPSQTVRPAINFNNVFNPVVPPSTPPTKQGITVDECRGVGGNIANINVKNADGTTTTKLVCKYVTSNGPVVYPITGEIATPSTPPQTFTAVPVYNPNGNVPPVANPTNSTVPPITGIVGGVALVAGGAWLWYAIANKSAWQIVASSVVAVAGAIGVGIWFNNQNNNAPQGALQWYNYKVNGVNKRVSGNLTGCDNGPIGVGTFCDGSNNCGSVRCGDITLSTS